MKLIAFAICLLLILNTAKASTSPCDQLKLAASYDVIVVGTGLGGSVAARRLAEWNPDWNILTVERGPAFEDCPACADSSINGYTFSANPVSGPLISTTAQPSLNNLSASIKDAAIQGGATSIGGQFHVRGDTVRLFEEYFPANWNWTSMIPFFERYENYTFPSGFHKTPWTYDSELRGNSGPVVSSQLGPLNVSTTFLDALRANYRNMPISYNTSINDGPFPGIGSSYPESTVDGQYRVSAYTAYIRSYNGTNLKAIVNTITTRVVFDSSAQVTGVELMFNQNPAIPLGLGNQILQKCIVRTRKVVVAAGALATPKVLKLSGIGTAAELGPLNIPVVSEVPQVGNNLRDHFTLISFLIQKNSSVPIYFSDNSVNNYGWAYFNANDSTGVPNDFGYEYQAFAATNMILNVAATNLKSSGYVNLASADPTATPLINPNYFNNPADYYGAGLALMKTYPIVDFLGYKREIDPCVLFPCTTPRETVQAYINSQLTAPGYHFVGTAALCNVTNPLSLRVKGTRGLYVLDASIIPYPPASNSQAAVYAVSERGIDQINANMHLTYELQDIQESAGRVICDSAPDVTSIQ